MAIEHNVARIHQFAVWVSCRAMAVSNTWVDNAWGSIYKHGSTLISGWINNHMSSNVLDKITYPFSIFDGLITYSC